MSQINSVAGDTLTAMFDSRADAEDAVRRLVDAGIPQANVRLLPGYEADSDITTDTSEVHKGFFASLADFFMPDEDRYSYAEGLRRGGYMVSVSEVQGSLREQAIDILDDEGAINLDEREENWRTEGWAGYADSGLSAAGSTGYSSTAKTGALDVGGTTTAYNSGTTGALNTGSTLGTAGYSSTSTTSGLSSTTTDFDRDEVIPVVEEELRIGKRDVNLGRVRVRSYVRETPVNEDVSLRSERVEIERRAVDRPLTDADVAFQDRTIEAEEHSEEAVVSKQARVTEEISLRKEADTRTETVSDSVRKTEVEVEDDRGITNSGIQDGTLNTRR